MLPQIKLTTYWLQLLKTPLFVNVYDNADFSMVEDLASAESAIILAEGAAIVNCWVVNIAEQ